MQHNEFLDNNLIDFFLEHKKTILKELDDILINELKTINCNKFAVINTFNDVLIKTFDTCYEKLLTSYNLNEIFDIQINYYVLCNNILELIENYFTSQEDFEKIVPIIKTLSEDYSYKLMSVYNVTIEHLLSENNMKLS